MSSPSQEMVLPFTQLTRPRRQILSPWSVHQWLLWNLHLKDIWNFLTLPKTFTSASLTTLKPSTVWITTNSGKFLKRWECQTTLPASRKTSIQVKKQQVELDMEQRTDYKLGKEYIKAVYCHPAHLTHMQSTSWEMLGWMKHKLESRLPGEISITSDMQMTPPLWQKVKAN